MKPGLRRGRLAPVTREVLIRASVDVIPLLNLRVVFVSPASNQQAVRVSRIFGGLLPAHAETTRAPRTLTGPA